MKKLCLIAAAALLAAPSALTAQITLQADADARVRGGTPNSNIGAWPSIGAKSISATSTTGPTVKSYIRFDTSGVPQGPLSDVTLSLTNATDLSANNFGPAGQEWNFAIYGLNHDFTPAAGVLDRDWLEGTGATATGQNVPGINWNNAPGNDTTHPFNVNPAETELLATFSIVNGGTTGEVLDFSSDDFPELLDYVASSPDGLVNFILVRTTLANDVSGSNQGFHAFFSKEAGPLGDGFIDGVFAGPTLTVNVVPEPSSLAAWSLAALALAGLGYLRLRRSRG